MKTITDSNTKANTMNSFEKWGVTPHVLTLENSIIREILKLSSQPGVISFAGGLPAPEMFPEADLKEASIRACDTYHDRALQYSISMGVPEFRTAIAEFVKEQVPDINAENVLITSGSQQGLDIVARAFISPGDYIICEAPTYVGALQAFNFYQAKYETVDMDDQGMITEQLEAKVKKFKPKFIYVVPNFQNPSGITMSLKRRIQLVEIANKYDIPVVEDNPYGELRFEGEPMPSLTQLGGNTIITLMTFSKICAPGFRIAWLIAPEDIMPVFEKVKQGGDLHTSTFSQYVMLEYLKMGKLNDHIKKIIKCYGARRDVMIKAMDEYFPSEAKYVKPDGGLFLWLTLPKGMSGKDLLPKAIGEKVAYVYGAPFFPNGGGEDTLRLNFSNASDENIIEGIKRLGKIIKDNM
ncbi:MAG: PLP-dependent aminotransferase family protein [candidate division Zixibacteria bacterium]|nr:PLP-dependent aminotransferase family protein [candidate division Zixibacteria bacterium]